MSTISLRLPDSLHKSIRKLAPEEDISINQLITTAVAEKMSALTLQRHFSTTSMLILLVKVYTIQPDECCAEVAL